MAQLSLVKLDVGPLRSAGGRRAHKIHGGTPASAPDERQGRFRRRNARMTAKNQPCSPLREASLSAMVEAKQGASPCYVTFSSAVRGPGFRRATLALIPCTVNKLGQCGALDAKNAASQSRLAQLRELLKGRRTFATAL